MNEATACECGARDTVAAMLPTSISGRRGFWLVVGVACASLVGACVTPDSKGNEALLGAGAAGGAGGGGAVCGDGVVDADAGETCDPPESCPSCDDGLTCTTDAIVGAAATCNVECFAAPVTQCGPDGCCPPGCSAEDDPDCSICGNGIVEQGEACDGNCPTTCVDVNVCTTDIMTGAEATCDASCSYAPIVGCVDGDGCCPPACSAADDAECALGRVYMASVFYGTGFFEYTVATNTWLKLADPPVASRTQITTDGTNVYMIGEDTIIYAYNPAQAQWTAVQDGPDAVVIGGISALRWTPQGFYFVNDDFPKIYYSVGDSWLSVDLPFPPSCAASYDPVSANLYLRIYDTQGVMVFNTVSNTVTQVWETPLLCKEETRAGSYLAGFFYTMTNEGPIHQTNMTDGTVINTGLIPSETYNPSSDVDPALGRIYFGPYNPTGTTFQVYEPMLGTLTTLAPAPEDNGASTIVVVK